MLYFAYGLNTNLDSMAARCAGAKCLGHARLLEHGFRFAHHADVYPCDTSYVDGVLWEITDSHLAALDTFEGYPVYYTRVRATVSHRDRIYNAVVYRMQPPVIESPPAEVYYQLVLEGYKSSHVPVDQLENSLALFG